MATGWPMKTTYADGDVYSAQDVNDITGTINQLGKSVAYTAGKNRIINGDFGIWQRGTSFTLVSNTLTYGADRHYAYCTIASGTTTLSRQTFTPGAAPISGYEGSFYRRLVCSAGTSAAFNAQRIEDVRTYAGQTITFSFFAKASSSNSATIYFTQNFGSGGSAAVDTTSTVTIGTSWARYTITVTLPSISGKTIGTSSFLDIAMSYGSPASLTIEDWGWQVEIGSTATAFQTATGTIQGELAACQRYYIRWANSAVGNATIGMGLASNTTAANINITYPVTMRTAPTTMDYSNLRLDDSISAFTSGTPALESTYATNDKVARIVWSSTSGLTSFRPYFLSANTSAGYLGLSAEL
jgi:hypothetical protein